MLEKEEYTKLYLDRDLKKAIYKRVSKIASKVGLELSPEDLHQDIFLKVWENRAKCSDDSNVKGWVFTVAHNVVMDHIKAELARLNRDTKWAGIAQLGWDDEGNLEPIDETKDNPEEALERTQVEIPNIKGVEQLPTPLWEVLRLKAEDLTTAEIAERLGISEALVRKRLERARTRLKN